MSGLCYNKNMKKGLGISLGLGVLALMLCNVNVSAIEKETDFIVDVDPQAMLVVPNEPVVLNFSPSQSGSFNSASFDVFASTNSKNGYTLTIQTTKTHLESNYVDPDTGIAPQIPAMSFVDGGITADEFSASTDSNVLNHWGISIGNNSSYNPVQTSGVIKTTASATSNDKTTINVAAKVNTDVAFGTYATTINFALTPNIINAPRGVSGGSIEYGSGGEGAGFAANTLGRSYEIYYNDVLQKSIYVKDDSTPEGYHQLRDGEDTTGKGLYFAIQDMNSTICDRVKTIPSELQVIDLRDAKVYWISKLADGHCWMTQNLDLDLSSSVALTPADTDIRQNWIPKQSTTNYDGKMVYYPYIYEWNNNSSSTNIPFSLDVGDWYWIGNWDDNGTNTWEMSNSSYSFLTGQVGDPPRFKFRSTFEGNREHGHVGNYYSFSAATAMDDSSRTGSETVAQSICPAHWTLPNYIDYSTDPENSHYYNLLNVYNVSSNEDRIATAAPLYFVRAGYMSDYYINNPGVYGYYWTSRSYSSSSAYYLYLNPSSAYATSTLSKYYKASIRCIAR